jgi:feruloyl esterase
MRTVASKILVNFVRLVTALSVAVYTDINVARASPDLPPASDRCAALPKILTGMTIRATTVSGGLFRDGTMPAPATIPALCRVQGTTASEPGSEINFEVWLPLTGWNGRFYGVGNGGFGGSITYQPGLIEAARSGVVGMSTDTGHIRAANLSFASGVWAHDHPERLKDYGYRAIHLSTLAAKQAITVFYGHPPHHSYFVSCSNGGRQGLMEAQRYPDDYDGIIAGAPAYHWTAQVTGFIWNTQALAARDAMIPAAKVPILQQAILQRCDGLDGVKDGLIRDPRRCHFDPRVLLCKGPESDACLTAAQLGALERIYSGPRTANGRRIYPGFPASGAEVGIPPGGGWDGWILPLGPDEARQSRYPDAFLHHFGISLNTDVLRFDFDRDYPILHAELAPTLDATDADLSRFAARGGKLILWHGWADPAVPPQQTIDYFENVRRALGRAATNRMTRLFMVPGVQHCSGGPGLNTFGQNAPPSRPEDPKSDMAAALEAWVETGKAPNVIVARAATNMTAAASNWRSAQATRRGLLCAFPRVPVWDRSGDPKVEISYRCADVPH